MKSKKNTNIKQNLKSLVIGEPCLDMNRLFSVMFILSKYTCNYFVVVRCDMQPDIMNEI